MDLLGNRHEPAVKENDHPVLPPGALDGVEAHEKVFGGHDPITQLLVHNHLHRPCIVTDNVVQPPGGRLVENCRSGCVGPLGDDLHGGQQVGRQGRHSCCESPSGAFRCKRRLAQEELSTVRVGDAHFGGDLGQRLARGVLGSQQRRHELLLGDGGW